MKVFERSAGTFRLYTQAVKLNGKTIGRPIGQNFSRVHIYCPNTLGEKKAGSFPGGKVLSLKWRLTEHVRYCWLYWRAGISTDLD